MNKAIGKTTRSLRGEMPQISIRITPAQLKVLNQVARFENKKVAAIIRRLLSESMAEGYLSEKFDLYLANKDVVK